MRILVTNDDGIAAPGLRALVSALSAIGEIIVYAPEREQSCSGHAITLHKPLRIRESSVPHAAEAFSVSGTPADCVVLACLRLPQPPDLVVSGINAGANLSEEIFYSGTFAGALEGTIHGVRSMAVSVTAYGECDFRAAAAFAARFAPEYLAMDFPEGMLVNVNVPNLPPEEIKGVAITRLGRRSYANFVEKRDDPRGNPYYWFGGEATEQDSGEGTDIGAIAAGMISVTPTRYDLTAYEAVEALREQVRSLEISP